LHSTDKVTISDLWKSIPNPSFPPFFLAKLDVAQYLTEATEKAENLKSKFEKRKQ